MAKTALILLNYNNAEETAAAAERVRDYDSIDLVVLVDNDSSDGSRKILSAYAAAENDAGRKEVITVFNNRNGGYGYGNNRGIDAAAKEGCEYALIANPDVSFSEKTVLKMQKALEDETVAAAGALQEGARYTDCAWPLLDLWGELAYAGPFTKRLFRREISYPRVFFKGLPARVGAVHGSLFMVRISDFTEAGCFDENVFLYMEEKILGKRIADIGKSVVLTDGVCKHAGGSSFLQMDAVKRQKERQKAERYYYKNYLGAGFFEMIPVYLEQTAVLLETELSKALKKKP